MVKTRFVLILLVALFAVPFFFFGQQNVPQGYFGSPLDIPLQLSGNFGELRTNHFHAGIDIKTQQREGLKVFAAAEGYVSRIKVSPVGYGYALYIDHPNGYTTVYGHLKSYSPKIDAYVKTQQYKLESFSVDLFPEPTALPLFKGELIGLSGNSGGSGGPHLHFEIRETKTEKVLNPMLFGFDIKDKIPPSVMGIWIVPMNESAFVNGGRLPLSFETKGFSGKIGLKSPTLPVVHGDVAFAIHTSDMLDGNSNRCGIYRIELWVDGIQVYGQRMDRLDFTTNRAMNAHTIYERFKKDRSQIHGSYRLPGNPLDIYDNLVNDGIVSFNDGKIHQLDYVVIDIMGNRTSVSFNVQSLSSPPIKAATNKSFLAKWNWEENNEYKDDRVHLKIPAYTLYEDLDLTIEGANLLPNSVCPAVKVASPYEPVHNKFTLGLKANIPAHWESKVTLVRWDPDKSRTVYEGGKFENGWVYGEPSYLGYFGVMIDTVKPSITNVDFKPAMNGRSMFTLKISDGLSGVDQIIPKIDGKWALMEYDAKTNRLMYYFDERYIQKGKHQFELTVIDACGNSNVFRGNFDW